MRSGHLHEGPGIELTRGALRLSSGAVSAGSNPAMPRLPCPGPMLGTSVVSDSGSETGAASRAHVWPDAVSLTAHSVLTCA
jgi:hypothetical protein